MVHGDKESPGARFEMLRSLEMKAFMLVSASYTVLDIRKMSQDVFDCLMEMAPKYIDTITLPSGWMHRTELRAAVAGYAKSGTAFKRTYQELEHEELEHQDLEPARTSKRPCIDPEPNHGLRSGMGQQNEAQKLVVVPANSLSHEERAQSFKTVVSGNGKGIKD
ncbi:hypothetical protein KJE20_14291 [Pyrenophora tritici-repentis]|nr:hypothetical protein KJE20_14291 [Pyrenophora tritici-repentis]